MTLLGQKDEVSDDIYLYDSTNNINTRVSRSSFGTPSAYLSNVFAQFQAHQAIVFPRSAGTAGLYFLAQTLLGWKGLLFSIVIKLPLTIVRIEVFWCVILNHLLFLNHQLPYGCCFRAVI